MSQTRSVSRGDWRAADLRGAGPAPSSVGAVVQRSWLGLLAARWSESALFGVAAMLVTLAAAELSMESPHGGERFGVALLAGLCGGLAWGIAHREYPRDIARRLDRRMRHDGALLTAWELERQPGELGAMGKLLQSRVLRRLRTREALRALYPSAALPLAAPLLAWALFALAHDARAGEERGGVQGADLQRLAEGGAQVIRAAWMDTMNTELGSEDERAAMKELADVERALRNLALRPPPDSDSDSDGSNAAEREWAEEIEELDAELARLGPRLGRNTSLAAAIDHARTSLDAVRMGLPPAADGPSTPPEDASDGGTGDGDNGTRLAGGDGGGTMSGSPASGASSLGGTLPVSALPMEVGAGTGRWWSAGQDGVVEHWIELRRLALAESELEATEERR